MIEEQFTSQPFLKMIRLVNRFFMALLVGGGGGGSITNNCSLLNRSTSLPESFGEITHTKFFFPAFVCKCDLDLRSNIKSGKPIN